MIKADELHEFRPQVRYPNGENITLSTVREAIEDCAKRFGIPIAFRNDQVKSGGLFKSSVEDCLVLYHPEHEKTYYKFCIRIRRQGTYAFVSVEDFGISKEMEHEYHKQEAKANVKGYFKANAEDYNAIGKAIGGAIGHGIRSIGGGNKKKLEDEKAYYQCISDIFDEIIR